MSKAMKDLNTENHITLDIPLQKLERSHWVSMPMPTLRTGARFLGWMCGRIAFMALSTSLAIIKASAKGIIWAVERLESGINFICKYYDALPQMGMPLQAIAVASEPNSAHLEIQPTTDLLEAIRGKHCLIIGSTGTGKSTLAQWLASRSASQIKIYDADASPSDWAGLEVIGRGGSFEEIELGMLADLGEMQRRIEARAVQGDKAVAGLDLCLICEEFPLIKDECSIAPEWLGKIARRGRKPKIFIIALSQSDSVTALGIEGDGAIRSNFRYIRLGSHAVTHARKLKDEGLVQWLQSGKYRCLVDDDPCQLPDLSGYGQFPMVMQPNQVTLPSVTAEPTPQQVLQPENFQDNQFTQIEKSAILALISAGYSDSKIIKDVLGYKGDRYQQGKQMLQKIIE